MRRAVQDQAASMPASTTGDRERLSGRCARTSTGASIPQACGDAQILLDQRQESGIPAGPPGDAMVAHKTGNISTVHHDAGNVYIGKRRLFFRQRATQFGEKRGRDAVAEVADIGRHLARSR
jgi:beta-lactamase class A